MPAPTMPAPAVEVRGLTKTYRVFERPPGLGAALKSVFRRAYKDVHAVRDLAFHVDHGERIGFLGPNGAGKTTTLKMLAGLLVPSSGEVRVTGHVPRERSVEFLKSITLVMGQKQQLIWDLPPVETFALNRAIYEIPAAEFDATMKELDDLLGLGKIAEKPTRQLSLGERMKCELAAALLHRPRVLFLDEPTIGLDVSMQLAVREFVRAYNERTGATVLLTSHYMDDVASLCRRVVVIDEGRLRYDGDLAALTRSILPDKRVVLRFGERALARAELERVGVVVELDAAHAVLRVAQRSLRDAVGHLLGDAAVTDVTVEDPPLEEVMRELFAHRDAAEAAR
ncbi:MAG TPA: ATP-binding cassette domain-containing protein [Minicystis sp.]|nr:ATP-binding cassette domain-containing protein [Minicystis sp.]